MMNLPHSGLNSQPRATIGLIVSFYTLRGRENMLCELRMGGITGDVVRGKLWVVNASISHCRAGGHTRKLYFLPTSPNPDVVVFFFAPSLGPPVVKKGSLAWNPVIL